MAGTTLTWRGGSLGTDQGRYETAADWSPSAQPQPGDTVSIVGVANSGIGHIGEVTSFPLNSPYTSVYLFPPPAFIGAPLQAGYDITGQILDLNGTKGALQLWAQQTTLASDRINVTGTAVLESYLTNRIGGAVTVGTAQGAGTLELDLYGTDTAGQGGGGGVPATVLGGTLVVNAGSTLKIIPLTGDGEPADNLYTKGQITVQAGGTLFLDDTDGGGLITNADNNTSLVNTGLIAFAGAAGKATSGTIFATVTGAGTIEVAGGGGAGSTTLTLNGAVLNTHLLLDGGTIAVNDTQTANGDPNQPGYNVAGGTFTFGAAGGTLLLHQPPLTTLQFVDHDTRMEQRPDGQHPFTTPISGFGAGSAISLVNADTGGTYVTDWSPATHLLQVESPAATQGYPPEILAAFTLEGSYSASGFHLTGNAATELLTLTYGGAHSG